MGEEPKGLSLVKSEPNLSLWSLVGSGGLTTLPTNRSSLSRGSTVNGPLSFKGPTSEDVGGSLGTFDDVLQKNRGRPPRPTREGRWEWCT